MIIFNLALLLVEARRTPRYSRSTLKVPSESRERCASHRWEPLHHSTRNLDFLSIGHIAPGSRLMGKPIGSHWPKRPQFLPFGLFHAFVMPFSDISMTHLTYKHPLSVATQFFASGKSVMQSPKQFIAWPRLLPYTINQQWQYSQLIKNSQSRCLRVFRTYNLCIYRKEFDGPANSDMSKLARQRVLFNNDFPSFDSVKLYYEIFFPIIESAYIRVCETSKLEIPAYVGRACRNSAIRQVSHDFKIIKNSSNTP